MIEYIEKDKLVHLFNRNISYYISINESGYLETRYIGRRFDDNESLSASFKPYNISVYDSKQNKEVFLPGGLKLDTCPLEISSHGSIDKREAPVIFTQNDGSTLNRFIYISHTIYSGIKRLDDLPCADGALSEKDAINATDKISTVVFLLKEKKSDVYVHLSISIYDDKDVIIKNFTIENRGDRPIYLKRALSAQIDFCEKAFKIHHFKGTWTDERNEEINEEVSDLQCVKSNYGKSSHNENPFIFLSKEGTTYSSGLAVGLNLIYSGNFIYYIGEDPIGATHIVFGINDEDFSWKLNKGEHFVTPQAVIALSFEGIDKMSQNMHRFIKEDLITYKKDKEYRPILFNSWEGCSFNFDTESLISYIEDAKKIGTELFVLDDGWFGARNDDLHGLGDRYVNEKKVNLTKVISKCHELNMKFGIRFEPEMINFDSDLFRKHPDYSLANLEDETILRRHQLCLDFTRDEVIEEIFKQMCKILDKYAIDYIKRDHNRQVFEHYSKNLPSDRQGETYHRLVLGYYKLFEKLVKKYPNIMFEGCSGGGGRFDLGTLYYTPQIWASDCTDPSKRMFIQFNTSLGYPLSTIGSHVSDSPTASYATKAALALFGSYGYEMNPNELNNDDRKTLSAYASIYKEHYVDVINEGTLYHLLSPHRGNYMALIAVSSDKRHALMIFMNKFREQDKYNYVKLPGLDPKFIYKNDFDGGSYSGDFYANVGINIGIWDDPFTAHIIVINAIESSKGE
jgi:alpha-galactosidase